MIVDSSFTDLVIKLNEKNYRNTLCMYTWVIIQAFIDYANKSCNKRMIKVRKNAEEWIMKENEDFKHICDIVSISPAKVRAKFLQLKNKECDLTHVINSIKGV